MNCMGIRYGDEMIVVDAGMGFPEETPFGVDISIPNFDFLEEYRDDLTAIILTHGHEDHIGRSLTSFENSICRFTLRDSRSLWPKSGSKRFDMLDDVLLHRVKANDVVEIGSFKIEFIHASHSLVECFSLAITHAGRDDHSHRRLQDRRHAGDRQAVRSENARANTATKACLRCCAIRQTRPCRDARRRNRR